jgi:hypothetical protein
MSEHQKLSIFNNGENKTTCMNNIFNRLLLPYALPTSYTLLNKTMKPKQETSRNQFTTGM